MYLPVIALFFAIQLVAGLSMAQVNAPVPELEGLETTEHLGAQLPLDATFRDHTGANVRLSNVLNGTRPAVLVCMYHSCPMLGSLGPSLRRRQARYRPGVGDKQRILKNN